MRKPTDETKPLNGQEKMFIQGGASMTNIEATKQMAKDYLAVWQKDREDSLIELADHKDFQAISEMFGIADELTSTMLKAIDIEHHFAPQAVAVLSALILGITNGNIIVEFERLFQTLEQDKSLH